MAVTYRSYGSSPGADSNSCVITKPAGLEVGDLMIAQVVGRGASVATFTAPANWTSIRQNGAATFAAALFWKIANAADAAATNFTFTAAGCGANGGAITAWTGHDPTTPINANEGQHNASSTTVTSGGITPSVANCIVLLFCGAANDFTINGYAIATDNPASWGEAYDLPLDLAYDLGLALGYASRPETSATGNGTATLSTGTANVGQLIAIAPAIAITEKTSAETGSGADAKITGNPLATQLRAETGTGADALFIKGLLMSEVGSGIEHYRRVKEGESSELLAFLTKTEEGTGAETLLERELEAIQLGSGLDALFGREFILSETGSGEDASVVLAWAKVSADTGAGAEELGSRSLVFVEPGTGTETVLDRDIIIITETGLGVDIVIELFTPMRVSSDGGVGTENIGSRGIVLASETSEGLDELVDLLATIIKADSGAGLETLISHAKAVADSGIGTEALVSLLVALNRPDAGVGIERVLGRSLVLTETGIGYDSAIPIFVRILSLALFFRAHRDLGISAKPHRDLTVTAKPYRDLKLTTRGG